jgi:hypothetical protein
LDGPADLAEYIAGDPFFGRCAAEHLLAFALGRATQATDLPHLKRIATAPDLRAMVHAVVQSPPFRQQSPRRLEAP